MVNLTLKVPRWPETDWAIVRHERSKSPPTPYAQIARMLTEARTAMAVRQKVIYERHAEASGHARGAGRRAA